MISFPSQQVWEHCYDSQWNGMIVKEAFMHPAKLSRGLIERIYDQMIERGWLRRSDMVADCFGGVGCGGVTAAYRGLHWFGVELEQRFVGLARRNFELHKPKLEYIGCPQPQIVQGDSRRFAEIVRQHCKALVTSPPYAETPRGNEHCGIDWEKAQQNGKDSGNHSHGASVSGDYGKTEGQIGGLPSGEVDAVVGSPPYSQPHNGGGGINVNGFEPSEVRRDALAAQHLADLYASLENGALSPVRVLDGLISIFSEPRACNTHDTSHCHKDGDGGGISKIALAELENLLASNAASCAPSWLLASSFRVGCPVCSHFCDEQFQTFLKAFQGSIPSRPGACIFFFRALRRRPCNGCVSVSGFLGSWLKYLVSIADEQAKIRLSRHRKDEPGARSYQGRGGDRTDGNIETLAQGDVAAVVTSPPWESNCEGGRAGDKFKNKDSILKSNRGNGASDEAVLAQAERDKQKIYGESAGQIGKLSGGSVDAAITSPPYADISAGAGGLNTRPARKPGQQSGRNPSSASQTGNWSKDILRYGKTEGQISQLEKGPLDATVTSPPYGETLAHGGGRDSKQDRLEGGKSLNEIKTGYGNTEGQIDPQTYWQAMDQVYRQCFEVIKPGGFLVVVLKNYVKERKVVDLSGDSARLLAHIGFEPVLQVRAMLTRETVHNDLFDGARTETRSRKSFFRRLAEKKGSPKIDWEDVLFFKKP